MELDYGPFIEARIGEWAYWIVEREAMRRRKAKGQTPYSPDPVMAGTRWCNVRRMDDKVSIWLMDNWYPEREAAADMPKKQIVACALAARMINRTETLSHITGGKRFSSWSYEKFRTRMYEVKDTGEPVFTNAYIINGASGGPKIEQVLNAIEKCYETKPFYYLDTESMQNTARHLHALPGIGGFMAGQVVADLRWVLDVPGYNWLDRMSWAPPGPGSSRGMKYLLGLSSASDMAGRGNDLTEKQFLLSLPKLISIAKQHPEVGKVFRERKLEAHDIQNTLCELGKYIRVKNGGHAKNKYPPRAGRS
jgi:hypothetical protein